MKILAMRDKHKPNAITKNQLRGVYKVEEQNSPITVFCCYARKDKDLLDELTTHLSPLQKRNVINVWFDSHLIPGTEWESEIKKRLNEAKIILLLVSADLINSDYCYSIEMQIAMTRYSRREATIIPVLLRPVSGWENISPRGDIKLGDLQALPAGAKAVTTWESHDSAWEDVVKGIEGVVNGLLLKEPVLPAKIRPSILRRTVLAGLGTIAIAGVTGGSIAFFAHSQGVPHTTLGGKITEFFLPVSNSGPVGIAAGPDSNLWFTEQSGNKIGRISPSGTITEFLIPTSNSIPVSIALGPDSNLWFTESNSNKIGRISPSGTITEFLIPTPNSIPVSITAGPDNNLWFTESNGNKIGHIGSDGTITEFLIPTPNSGLVSIILGPDNNLWFTEWSGNKIGRISSDGTIIEFLIPTPNSGPDGITLGPDGNLWFTEWSGSKIGHISPSGTIIEFLIPTPNSGPLGITLGPDNNLWFTEQNGNKIGRISRGGTITEFSLPTLDSNPVGITVGSDDNLWFAEQYSNKIGRITSDK